jgi:zinc finger protein-like protein
MTSYADKAQPSSDFAQRHVSCQPQERLFEQLSQLLNAALGQPADQRVSTVQQLVCKSEEIHTTLRKHLAKEEEQLFPLLLRHFSHAEQVCLNLQPRRADKTSVLIWACAADDGKCCKLQASLVAQFLCTIPLVSVETVLAWLKPNVPVPEQEQLCRQVRAAPCPTGV